MIEPPSSPRPAPETVPLPALRVLDRTLVGTAANLALDEALVREAEEEVLPPLLRIWEPTEDAVVLGASGRLHQEVHVEACRQDGVVIARRSSGGGTVLIGPGALNVAVILPQGVAPALRTVEGAQAYVLERFAGAFRARGRPVQVQGSGDLTLGGRKFAGSAQRRLRTYVMVHATILCDFPQGRIGRYLAEPRRQPAYRAARRHEDFLTNLGWPADVVREVALAAWTPPGASAPPAEIPWGRVRGLLASQFGDPAWTGRF